MCIHVLSPLWIPILHAPWPREDGTAKVLISALTAAAVAAGVRLLGPGCRDGAGHVEKSSTRIPKKEGLA